MKSLKIHGAMDLRIEDFPLENLSSNQVEISIATGGICFCFIWHFIGINGLSGCLHNRACGLI